MEKKKIIKFKKRDFTAIIIIIITMLLFFSGYSLGKAYQSTTLQASGEIAEPILVVENNPVVEINGKNEKEYYNFIVKNSTDEGKITEVDLEYYIEILTKTDEAISFKLYRNNDPVLMENNTSEKFKMSKEKEQKDNYKLEIIYDKTKNNSIEDIVQDVQIKVHSEQIKI